MTTIRVLQKILQKQNQFFNQKTITNISMQPQVEKNNNVMPVTRTDAVHLAAKLLASNEVIALPTDTVYGLACNANDPSAIQKLYDIKGRDEKKPVAICVPDISSVKYYGVANHLTDDLLKLLLPGPVTLVLHKSRNLDNPFLNPGVMKIGIRIPDHNFIQNVTQNCRFPVALTSANRSNEKSTLQVTEFQNLWEKLGTVFDGGQLGLGTDEQRAASTVIDLSCPGEYQIIREGIAVKQTVKLLEEHGLRELIKN